jgi:hypothetical protein
VDRLLSIERHFLARGVPDVELVPVLRFDERVTEVEVAARACGFYRDHTELNWVISNPWIATDYRYLPYAAVVAGRMIGFALVRVRRVSDHVLATVLRIGVAPEHHDLIRGFLAALLRALSSADVVDLYTNDAQIAGPAHSLGMRRRAGTEVTWKLQPAAEATVAAHECLLEGLPIQYGEGDAIFA